MKIIILILFVLTINVITSAKILEFKGVILEKKHHARAKYYTKIDNKDFCTTITYIGRSIDKNKILKQVFQITENQNNKELKSYKVLLGDKEFLKINEIKFKFLIFRGEFIFLKTEE